MPHASDRNAGRADPVTTRQRRYRDQHGLRSTDIAWHTASLLASLRAQTDMRNDELLAWATRLLWDSVAKLGLDGDPTDRDTGAGAGNGVVLARVTDSVDVNDSITVSSSLAAKGNDSVSGDATPGVDRPMPQSGRPHRSGQSPRAHAGRGMIPDKNQKDLWYNIT